MKRNLLKVKEFAKQYGLSIQAVYNHIASGELPAYKIVGTYYIDEDAVLEQSKVTNEA